MVLISITSLLILVDSIISFVCGFGISTLLIPILLFWYPTHTVLILVGFLHLLTNLNKILLLTKSIDWRLFMWLGIPAIFMSILGAHLTSLIDRELFLRVLGIVLFLYVFSSIFYLHIKLSRGPITSIIAGSVYGFIEGMTGIGGVLRVSLFYGYNLSPSTFIATSGLLALLVDIARVSTYLRSSTPTIFAWWHYLLFGALTLAGSIIGRHLIKIVPINFLRYAVLAAVSLVSVKLIIAP